ncbi:peptidase C15, pyroglutamyl peptidase I-like protein [Auriculariales sp. MPI-PUGE-AT-0066]|nr:peptidase C15, pyroglutamyl peptidase I-like protein [Auriculariales sp. MPI-PUGE-AT-0066]
MPPTTHRNIYVLITGFDPIPETAHHPSYYAAKPLNGTQISLPGHRNTVTLHLTVIEVPVVYADVLSLVPGLHQVPPTLPESGSVTDAPPPPQGGYDFIFHLGQELAGAIYVETLGHQAGYNEEDLMGELPPVMPGARPFAEPENGIKITDDRVVQSHDAGRFLCDFIYNCSLAESARKVLFMHVPHAGRPHTLDEMTQTIRQVVSWVAVNYIDV